MNNMANVDLIFQPTRSNELAALDLNVLSEQFRVSSVTDWTIPQAFLCLLLSAAVSDGHLAPEEMAQIQCLSVRSRALKALGPAGLVKANAEVNKRLKERPHGLQEACEVLPPDLRLPMFAHCVDIVLADGQLLQPEVDFLNRITAYLDLNPDDAQFVMKALLIKNRC
ncbi:MAG: TerB family tellurite resistance protein [Caulobacterales bacterium]